MENQLPRYFIKRADESASEVLDEALPLTHIVDSFLVESPQRSTDEYIIAVDSLGNLRAISNVDQSQFSPELQAELSFHELSNRGSGRRLLASEFYLFNVQLLEQPANVPGINDPIYLYGRLSGPYPGIDNRPTPVVEGQLTITRADLLDGLLCGVDYAFCYTGSQSREPLSRCFHLLLPGDREEEIRQGQGIILAYPLMPPELLLDNPANEFNVCQLLYDVLCAMKEDISRDGIENPLRSQLLPVPNRMMLEQQLKTEGYIIKGDTAIKQSNEPSSSFSSLLASIVGAIAGNKVTLPPEGKVNDYFNIARATLTALAGWPPARILALRAAIKPANIQRDPLHTLQFRSSIPHTPAGQILAPSSTATSPIKPVPPRVKLTPKPAGNEPPGWMQDFLVTHRQPGNAAPRLTLLTSGPQLSGQLDRDSKPPVKRARQLPVKEADWMSDFERAPVEKQPDGKRETNADKPDWMKDFD